MTTGSYSDIFTQPSNSGSPADWVGSKTFVDWTGGDNPSLVKPAPVFRVIERLDHDLKTGRARIRKYKIRDYSNWKPKRSRDVPHAYTKNYLRLEQADVILDFGSFAQWRPDMATAAPGSWAAASMLTANHQISLVNKLSEKLQGSDFNASVFLGEGHQTLKMLADSATRIAKAGFHARKLDILGAARALFEGTTRKPLARHDWVKNRPVVGSAKNAASIWLELQYGWLPLLGDAKACAESLAAYLEEPLRQKYRAAVRVEADDNVHQNIAGLNVDCPRTRSHRRSIIAYVAEKPTAMQQLGMLDPELVAWELLPFSFVADWFIPIGSWMEARAAASRLTGTFVTTDKMWARAGPVALNGVSPTSSTYRNLIFTRSISSTLDVPMPVFKPLSKALSWRHCANAVALVTQVFSPERSTPLTSASPKGSIPPEWWKGLPKRKPK